MPSIEEHRTKIDAIDRELVRLLSERALAANEIGILKKQAGRQVFDESREAQVFANVLGLAREIGSRIPEENLRCIYREIIRSAHAVENAV